MRGLLLAFDGAHGALSTDCGYHIDPEDGFTEGFGVRGEAVRSGDRVYGAFAVNQTDAQTGDSTILHILSFAETPTRDSRVSEFSCSRPGPFLTDLTLSHGDAGPHDLCPLDPRPTRLARHLPLRFLLRAS